MPCTLWAHRYAKTWRLALGIEGIGAREAPLLYGDMTWARKPEGDLQWAMEIDPKAIHGNEGNLEFSCGTHFQMECRRKDKLVAGRALLFFCLRIGKLGH